MLATTYNAATAYLLNDEPDWRERVTLHGALPADKHRSLTGREARRPVADALRCSLRWTALLNRTQANALRDCLQLLSDEPILCPAWPFALAGADWSTDYVSGGLLIGWLDDWSDFELDPATPADWDQVAPCLVGRLAATPEPAPADTENVRVDFDFVEDADATTALAPATVSWTNGPALGDATTPKLFPFQVTWNEPRSGAAEVVVDRQSLGRSRQSAAAAYEQDPERLLSADLLLTSRTDIATLLKWFVDRRGVAEAHYVTEALAVTDLAATANSGTAALTVSDGDDVGSNRFLELSHAAKVEVVRVNTVAGDTLNLTANLVNTWPASLTLMRLACLARFAREDFDLDFVTPEVARVRLAWRELPAEYTVAAGETRGTTLGALTTKAWLYLVTLDWNGATEAHRFTSFEQDLTASGQTWTSRPAEHSELRQSLKLDRDEVTLKVRWWADCPFRQFLPNALDAKITLAIYECTVSGSTGSNVTQWFGGEITACAADGPFLTASAAGANALFDRRCPRLLMQPTCNHALFDAGCGLDRDDWEITADVYDVSGVTVTIENCARTGGLPDGFGFAHWFALGYIERTVSGIIYRHLIFDSAVMDGDDRIALTLGSEASPALAAEDSIKVYPGCDGYLKTCKAYADPGNLTGKFNNYAAFGGFPFIPATNPGFQPLKQSDSPTGKK